jgi:pilus assembly protein Flp/PilA
MQWAGFGFRQAPAHAGLLGFITGVWNMQKFTQHLVNFLKNEDGPTAVEYAVMLALIIVVCITAITTLGTNANNTFSYIGQRVGSTGS